MHSAPSGIRSTRAIIDLDAIAGNVKALRGCLRDGTRLMAVVKADGYGHGAPWVAIAALEAGASDLGVATVSEGVILRNHGILAPIVLLGSMDPAESTLACEAGLEITITEAVLLAAVQEAARTTRAGPVAVHLKVDTGLRRYGASPEQALMLASRIAADSHLRFAGVSTHFASADEPNQSFTREQISRFETFLTSMQDAGLTVPTVHAANSAGIVTSSGIGYEMVRAGIALYGVRPSAEAPLPPLMRPAMRIESRVAKCFALSAGDTVGYNRTFQATESMIGALIPIGYADGYRRALSGKGWVGIRGRPCAVLGRVSMDQIVVGLPIGSHVVVGDIAHVMNEEVSSGAPDVDALAEICCTNSYEILVGIGDRVPRVFVRGDCFVDVRVPGPPGPIQTSD